MKLNEIKDIKYPGIVLVEGRDDINQLILEAYQINETLLDEYLSDEYQLDEFSIGGAAKGLVKGAKAAVAGGKKAVAGGKALARGAVAGGKAAAAGGKAVVAGGKKAAEAVGKLNNFVNKAASKLQDTKPVQNFDAKVAQIIGNYKEKLGGDHKAVQMAQKMGELGKKHPKKTAFIIGALSGLASVLGSPVAGMAIGGALRTAMGLMQGERASTAVGNAAKVATVGTFVGMGAEGLGEVLGQAADIALNLDEVVVGDNVVHITGDIGSASNGTEIALDNYLPKEKFGEFEQLRKEMFSADGDAKSAAMMKIHSFLGNFIGQEEQLKSAFTAAQEAGTSETLQAAGGAAAAGAAGGAAAAKVGSSDAMIEKASKIISTKLKPEEKAAILKYVTKAI